MASCGDFSSHCTHWPWHHGFWSFCFQRSELQTQHFGLSQSRHHHSVACMERALRMESPFPASEPADSQCSRPCWWHEGNSYHSYKARRAVELKFQLLYAVLLSLPFIGIRMMYSVISILAPSKSLNPTSGSVGIRVGLSFIPELIAMLALVYAGLATLTLRREVKNTVEGEMHSAPRSRDNPSKLERGL